MKILIVSDTHKHNENLMDVLDKEKGLDMVIHCGDSEGLEDSIREKIRCPLYMVAGNNDFFSDLSNELVFNIGSKRVLLTHGHYYYVSMGIERLAEEAMARDIDIAIYGHTHMPKMEMVGNVTVINPGSISYPRQIGRTPTYMILEVDKDDNFVYTLHHYEPEY